MIINKTQVTFAGRVPYPRSVPVGMVGDNCVECVEFRLPTIDDEQTATLMLNCKYADAVMLSRVDDGLYCADITSEIACVSGNIEAYIRIDGASGAVWNSETFTLHIGAVPNVVGEIEERNPAIFEQTMNAIAECNAAMNQHGEAMKEALGLVADIGKGKETEIEVKITGDMVVANELIYSDGKAFYTEAWDSTALLPLDFDNGKPITVRCTIHGTGGLAFYDAHGAALAGINGENASDYGISDSPLVQMFSVMPPDNAAYVRMSGFKASPGNYTGVSDFVLKGVKTYDLFETLNDIDERTRPKAAFGKVLVIGDSISTDYYGEYPKWVTMLTDEGFFPAYTTDNNSIHATGFVARYNGEANDFITRVEAVENKASYDLVVIFGGINDFIQSVPMGESGGDKTLNFKPAVDYFFRYIIDNFTQARIAVLSPLRTSNTDANAAGSKQTDYADYIKNVAKSYCLPVLNLTDDSGFCPFIDSFKVRWTMIPAGYEVNDGVHPTEEYEREFLAPMIKGFLVSLNPR